MRSEGRFSEGLASLKFSGMVLGCAFLMLVLVGLLIKLSLGAVDLLVFASSKLFGLLF